MKKRMIVIGILFIGAMNLFSQTSKGDIELVQQYFGTQKIAMLQEYMTFTPAQDSAFWPIYKKYEDERLAQMQQRIALIEDYAKNVKDITEDKATELVNKVIRLDIGFKELQKKYFTDMAKKIGAVKAAQWYQFETYISNVIYMAIAEQIPFLGDMSQKHAVKTKK
jgi:ketosteroid isomerase-like protein